MKRPILGAVLLTTLSASLLCAPTTSATDTPPTPAEIAARMVARLTTLLGLTGAQQTSATIIFTAEQTALAALVTPMQTAKAALQTAVVANKLTDIKTAATTIGTLTTQQVTADATADAAFYAILTSDQQTKYTTLRLDDMGGPGPGPGGPGGGHGGPGH